MKVVSGQTRRDARTSVARVYGAVVAAGVHRAPSIKVAEAAKVIENTQRDLNIALMNELALIFDRMGIGTADVLRGGRHQVELPAVPPGLVGGHCIGVDPYYLTHKAEELGYHPQVILAGRRINDGMGAVRRPASASRCCSRATSRRAGRAVGILGLTFKENVPDIRNTRVVDIVRELAEFGIAVLLHDPMADGDLLREEYGLSLTPARRARSRRCHRAGRCSSSLSGRVVWDLVRQLLKAEGGSVADVPAGSAATPGGRDALAPLGSKSS